MPERNLSIATKYVCSCCGSIGYEDVVGGDAVALVSVPRGWGSAYICPSCLIESGASTEERPIYMRWQVRPAEPHEDRVGVVEEGEDQR